MTSPNNWVLLRALVVILDSPLLGNHVKGWAYLVGKEGIKADQNSAKWGKIQFGATENKRSSKQFKFKPNVLFDAGTQTPNSGDGGACKTTK